MTRLRREGSRGGKSFAVCMSLPLLLLLLLLLLDKSRYDIVYAQNV
jgi:hypothetical protein